MALRGSLFASPAVPRWVAFSVPVVLLACVGVMVHANLTVGTAIEGYLGVGRYESEPYPVFDFTMWGSVTDMWNAKAYALSFLIGAWSGIWPYVKVALLLVCWMAPTHWFSAASRSITIHILALLGKWALVDIFLLVIFDVAFRFHVPLLGLNLDLVVKPGIGSFTFIASTVSIIACINLVDFYERNVLSLSSSHQDSQEASVSFVRGASLDWFAWVRCPSNSWFESKALEQDRLLQSSDRLDPKQSLSNATYARRITWGMEPAGTSHWRFKWTTKVALILVLCTCASMIVIGASIQTFSFHYKGFAGYMLDLAHQPDREGFSLLDLIRKLGADSTVVSPDDSPSFGMRVGLGFIQICFLFFSLVLPLLQTAMLGVLFLTPFSLRDVKIYHYMCSVVGSGSALDAFSVSVVVAMLQLDRFSLFLQKDHHICTVLKDVTHVDCFRVDTELLTGCWLMFSASFAIVLCGFFLRRIADDAIKEREKGAVVGLL